jgi:hypothetical protein
MQMVSTLLDFFISLVANSNLHFYFPHRSHNMDMTDTFMQEATAFFLEENLPRYLRGENLLNPVDAAAGY